LDPAELPDEYGMRELGDCMLPEIADNALLHFDKREPVKTGDTVIIYRRPEIVPEGQPQAQVKRLVLAIPDWDGSPAAPHRLSLARLPTPRDGLARSLSDAAPAPLSRVGTSVP
jgi:hypothetical protein